MKKAILIIGLLCVGIIYLAFFMSAGDVPKKECNGYPKIYYASGELADCNDSLPNGRYYVKPSKNRATTLIINQ